MTDFSSHAGRVRRRNQPAADGLRGRRNPGRHSHALRLRLPLRKLSLKFENERIRHDEFQLANHVHFRQVLHLGQPGLHTRFRHVLPQDGLEASSKA